MCIMGYNTIISQKEIKKSNVNDIIQNNYSLQFKINLKNSPRHKKSTEIHQVKPSGTRDRVKCSRETHQNQRQASCEIIYWDDYFL